MVSWDDIKRNADEEVSKVPPVNWAVVWVAMVAGNLTIALLPGGHDDVLAQAGKVFSWVAVALSTVMLIRAIYRHRQSSLD